MSTQTSDRPSTAVVVLSWNQRADTLACLASLRQVRAPLTVVVVDNGSTDGSADAVAEGFPEVVLVRSPENLGFAGGVNEGVRVALGLGCDAVLLLNNDMTVDPGFVEPLLDALRDDPLAAAACSQILYADRPDVVWHAGGVYRPGRGYHGRTIGFAGPRLPADRTPYAVDCGCAGAMLVPASALREIGPLDDALFAYHEDVDWSLRARAAGRRVLVVPASAVWHRVSGSSGGEASTASLYYDTRNAIVVAERHVPLGPLRTRLRRLEVVLAHAAQAVLARRGVAGLRAVVAGWRDAASGRLGRRAA